MQPLTDIQRNYLVAVIEHTRGPFGTPTLRSMRVAMGMEEAPRGWDRHILLALQNKGYIRRAPSYGSSIVPIRTPEGLELELRVYVKGESYEL